VPTENEKSERIITLRQGVLKGTLTMHRKKIETEKKTNKPKTATPLKEHSVTKSLPRWGWWPSFYREFLREPLVRRINVASTKSKRKVETDQTLRGVI